MRNIIIVTGGTVSDKLVLDTLSSLKDVYIIGVDRGLETLHRLNINPNLALGDFDSVDGRIGELYKNRNNTVLLNPKKDLTDTHAAVVEALKLNSDHITVIGATGTRIDHVLGNLAALKVCLDNGVPAELIDSHNRIRMVKDSLTICKSEQYGKYVSCIPFTSQVRLTIKGFLYELCDAVIKKEQTIGISNELREEEGTITVYDGCLIVIESKD